MEVECTHMECIYTTYKKCADSFDRAQIVYNRWQKIRQYQFVPFKCSPINAVAALQTKYINSNLIQWESVRLCKN